MRLIKTALFILLTIAVSLASGCAPPNAPQNSSTGAGQAKYILPAAVKEDDLFIFGDNFYYERYEQHNRSPLALRFTIISGKELDPEKIILSAETDVPCVSRVVDISEEEPSFPYALFLAYNQGEEYFNIDWKEAYGKTKEANDLFNKGKLQEASELSKWEDEYLKIYDRLDKSKYPSFYAYRTEIYFNYGLLDEFPTKPVEKIRLDINGQNYTLSGKITFLPPYETGEDHGGVTLKSLPGNYTLIPMSEGKCVFRSICFSADEDIDLTGISFPSEAVTVDTARLIIESGGAKMDVLWDCKSPLKIKKGSEVEATLIVRDRNFEGKLSYAADYHIIFEYERGGTKSSFVIAVEAYTRLHPVEMLAILRDGVDLLPYYYEYHGRFRLEGELK